MELCLFCNNSDKIYKPEKDADFVCGSCVQLFLSADKGDLKRAYQKAIERGYDRKARALESFIDHTRGETDGKRPERNFDRKRITRAH